MLISALLVILLLSEALVLDTSIRWVTGNRPGVLQTFFTSVSNLLATLLMLALLALYCRWQQATVGFWQSLRQAGATLSPVNPEGLVLLLLFGAVLCLIVATRHSLSYAHGILAYLTSRLLFATLGAGCVFFIWLGAKLAG